MNCANLERRHGRGESKVEAVNSGRQLERTVAALLQKANWTVEIEKGSQGMLVDIWATDGCSGELVVECKAFKKLIGVATARQFTSTVRVIRQKHPSLEAWLVTTSGFTPNALGILSRADIKAMTLNEVFAKCGGDREDLKVENLNLNTNGGKANSKDIRVFVIMPFSDDMLDVFMLGIRWVTEKLGMVAKRADNIDHNGEIIGQILSAIREYDIIVGDTSGANPNVCYEVGYAHGLGKQCVLICKKGNSLPFDLQGTNHLMYRNILDLRVQLENKLGQARNQIRSGNMNA